MACVRPGCGAVVVCFDVPLEKGRSRFRHVGLETQSFALRASVVSGFPNSKVVPRPSSDK